jgi:hypothetical protein
MAENPSGVYLSVDQVFPGTKNDFESFRKTLECLSLTDTLFWCARFNLLLSNPRNPDQPGKQAAVVLQLLPPNEVARVADLVMAHGGPNKVQVFFRPQLLELFRWACLFCEDKPGDGSTHENPAIKEAFSKALLAAGDLWADRIQLRQRLTANEDKDTMRRNSLGAVRKNFEATTSGPDPLKAMGRGYALFTDIFPKYYPNSEIEFLEVTGLSLDAYFACAALITAHYLDVTPQSLSQNPPLNGIFHFYTSVPAGNEALRSVFSKYLELESSGAERFRKELDATKPANEYDARLKFDYRILRRTPILRTKDGRVIVIDPVFFSEKLFAGPLFCLLGRKGADPDRLFSAFGKAFEEYSSKILGTIYSHRKRRLHLSVRGQDEKGHDIEVTDAAVDYGRTILLFEFKAVWVREDAILTDNPEDYRKHLREKYGAGADGLGKKGVVQLANAITKLAGNQWTCNELHLDPRTKIFPILLVNDYLVCTPLHGWFLAEEFSNALKPDEIAPDGTMRKGRWKISPLIVMSAQDLEDIETSSRYFCLREFFSDYARECPDRLVSMHNYLGTSLKYRNKLRHSGFVAGYAMKAIKNAETLMRGEAV